MLDLVDWGPHARWFMFAPVPSPTCYPRRRVIVRTPVIDALRP